VKVHSLRTLRLSPIHVRHSTLNLARSLHGYVAAIMCVCVCVCVCVLVDWLVSPLIVTVLDGYGDVADMEPPTPPPRPPKSAPPPPRLEAMTVDDAVLCIQSLIRCYKVRKQFKVSSTYKHPTDARVITRRHYRSPVISINLCVAVAVHVARLEEISTSQSSGP
jgi:hypothetical protein